MRHSGGVVASGDVWEGWPAPTASTSCSVVGVTQMFGLRPKLVYLPRTVGSMQCARPTHRCSGELSETLSTIAAYYDAELSTAISEALAKMEPAILVVIAAFAGYVVIAISWT